MKEIAQVLMCCVDVVDTYDSAWVALNYESCLIVPISGHVSNLGFKTTFSREMTLGMKPIFVACTRKILGQCYILIPRKKQDSEGFQTTVYGCGLLPRFLMSRKCLALSLQLNSNIKWWHN